MFDKKVQKYQRLFNKENDDAIDVLSDLSRFCNYNKPLYNSGQLDALQLAHAEGKRAVYLYIKSLLNISEEKLEAMLKGANNE